MDNMFAKILLIFLCITFLLFASFNYENKKCVVEEKIILHEKMQECIDMGGEYRLFHSSAFLGEEAKYTATCDIPEKELFRIEIKD